MSRKTQRNINHVPDQGHIDRSKANHAARIQQARAIFNANVKDLLRNGDNAAVARVKMPFLNRAQERQFWATK